MSTSHVVFLKDLLRAALREDMPDGWFYLPESTKIDLSTEVLLVLDTDDLEHQENGIPREAFVRGFPREGLDTSTLVSVVRGAAQLVAEPTDDLLLEAFSYYHEYDAYLPRPGAPHPPPRDEIIQNLDRQFYDSLGHERAEVRCQDPTCTRGAVAYSVLCRPHHFESIKRKVSPFSH